MTPSGPGVFAPTRNQVHVRATWECAACAASAARCYMVQLDDLTLRPPPGWTVVDGLAYCARHVVEVKVLTHNLLEFPRKAEGGAQS